MKTLLEAMNILKESSNKVECYRTIGYDEFYDLLDKKTIKGKYSNSTEKQNTSNVDNVVCFFKEPITWLDKEHVFMIKCKFNDILDQGQGKYYASKDFGETSIWTGRRGKTEYNLDEIYVPEYNIDNVEAFVLKGNSENPIEYLQEQLDYTNKWLEVYNQREQEDGVLSKKDQKEKKLYEEDKQAYENNLKVLKTKKIIKI